MALGCPIRSWICVEQERHPRSCVLCLTDVVLVPELPDLENYLHALRREVVGETLRELSILSPFVLRTVEPRAKDLAGRELLGVERIGKRIVLGFGDELYAVIHLMIAGRLRWRESRQGKGPGRIGLVRMDFERGQLWLTEASKKKRACLHLIEGSEALTGFARGGLEVLDADLASFRQALLRENRTLKRALTDPRILSGIGNAYSDEILFAAGLSPVKLTSRLDDTEIERLHRATQEVLTDWTRRLRDECGDGFPEKVTAFHPEMMVHGRYREDCRVCGKPIQRIRYASNECNYCVVCQNEGRLLADRGLSQLMRKDWPKTLEELEERKTSGRDGHESI